jgi:PilZ domain
MSAVAIPARELHVLELELHERRSCNRYPIRLDVEYRLLNRRQVERFGFGITLNISRDGILFHADEALPIGRSIKLAMQWPLLLEGKCTLKLHMRGVIVRSDAKRAAVQISHHEFRTAGVRTPDGSSAR